MTFRTTLQLHGKTATGIEVPPDIVAKLGGGGRVPVRVTLAGYTYATTIARMRVTSPRSSTSSTAELVRRHSWKQSG